MSSVSCLHVISIDDIVYMQGLHLRSRLKMSLSS